MPKIKRANPVCLRVYANQELADALKAQAGRRGFSVTELARRLLAQGVSRDAANDGTATIEAVVRRVIRKELAATHDMAFRAAFHTIVCNSMIRTFWINKRETWPLPATEATALEGEIRKDTAMQLRKKFELSAQPDDDDDEG